MEKDLLAIAWPAINQAEVEVEAEVEAAVRPRALNPGKPDSAKPSRKGRMPKFITITKSDRLEKLVPAFRQAVRQENPSKAAEAAIEILDLMKDNGGDYREINVVRDHLSHALGKYREGIAAAGDAIMAKIGTESVVKTIAEARDRTKPVVKKKFDPVKATFVDTVYRTKYQPAGNSLGAVLYGVSKFNLAKHLEKNHISDLDPDTMPGNYKGTGQKWVSKRSAKKAAEVAAEKARKQKAKEEREKAKATEKTKKGRAKFTFLGDPDNIISSVTGRKI